MGRSSAAADPERGLVLLGRGTAPGLAVGPLVRNRAGLDADRLAGAILVAERATPEDVPRIEACAATVTLGGSLLSHVSRLSRELGRPSVALDPGAGVALGPAGEAAVLVVGRGGERAPEALGEGTVAMVDGDRGRVTVPGGLDAARRRRVAALLEGLRRLASDPGDPRPAAQLARDAAGDPPLAGFLLEAAVVHRVLPAGEPSRRLLSALRETCGAAAIDERCRALAGGVISRGRLLARRALAAIEAGAEPAEPDDLRRAAGETLAMLGRQLDDLGGEPGPIGELRQGLVAAAAERRRALSGRVTQEIDRALALGDGGLLAESVRLRHVVRSARRGQVTPERVEELGARLDHVLEAERRRLGERLVVRLEDATEVPGRELVGAKAEGLFRARGCLPARCAVPRGFVLTTVAYRLHLAGETGAALRAALAGAVEAGERSRGARAALLAGEPPSAVTGALATALAAYGERCPLAVRSSSTVEDGPAGSLAGAFDTHLGVRGLAATLRAVRRCWASLWDAGALTRIERAGLDPLDSAQAVLVQELVATAAAGVMLTRDADGGDPRMMVVNAAWGLGEAVSAGELRGDVYRVRRETGEIVSIETSAEGTRIVPDPERAGTVEEPLPADLRGRPSLGPEPCARLAALARALEASFGGNLEVEFGVRSDGSIVLFQVRYVGSPGVGARGRD